MSSSVCRLPFIRSSPLPSRMSCTAFSAAAWLCGASTISKRLISSPKLLATDGDLRQRARPESGTMMPASAASVAPRSEVSSQGWATMVTTGWTCLARRDQFFVLARAGHARRPLSLTSTLMSYMFFCHRGSPLLYAAQAYDASRSARRLGGHDREIGSAGASPSGAKIRRDPLHARFRLPAQPARTPQAPAGSGRGPCAGRPCPREATREAPLSRPPDRSAA